MPAQQHDKAQSRSHGISHATDSASITNGPELLARLRHGHPSTLPARDSDPAHPLGPLPPRVAAPTPALLPAGKVAMSPALICTGSPPAGTTGQRWHELCGPHVLPPPHRAHTVHIITTRRGHWECNRVAGAAACSRHSAKSDVPSGPCQRTVGGHNDVALQHIAGLVLLRAGGRMSARALRGARRSAASVPLMYACAQRRRVGCPRQVRGMSPSAVLIW